MKSNFEQRKQNRIEYAKQQAEKNTQKSEEFFEKSRKIASSIPMGQPILIGHHSEKSHRRHLSQISGNMEQSIEADRKAKYYLEKAESIENNKAIFSDDPEAIEKLQTKIEQLEKLQVFMKSCNKLIKNKDKEGFLKLENANVSIWEQLNEPDRFGNLGFASYKLTNNNANIRRLKIRLEKLKSVAEQESTDVEIKGVRFVKNVEENRVQLFFSGIPSEQVRNDLKKKYAFRWSRSQGAWQRHLNNSGIYAANEFLKNYQE